MTAPAEARHGGGLAERWLGHLASTFRGRARRLDATAGAQPHGRSRHRLVQAAQRCRDTADELEALLADAAAPEAG